MWIDGNEDKFITFCFWDEKDHERWSREKRPKGSHSNAKRVIEKKKKTSLFRHDFTNFFIFSVFRVVVLFSLYFILFSWWISTAVADFGVINYTFVVGNFYSFVLRKIVERDDSFFKVLRIHEFIYSNEKLTNFFDTNSDAILLLQFWTSCLYKTILWAPNRKPLSFVITTWSVTLRNFHVFHRTGSSK